MTAQLQAQLSKFRLEFMGSSTNRMRQFDLPLTGESVTSRLLEVGSLPYRHFSIRLELVGLHPVHFYLKILPEAAWIYHEPDSPVLINNLPLPSEEWQNLEPGTLIDCGSNVRFWFAETGMPSPEPADFLLTPSQPLNLENLPEATQLLTREESPTNARSNTKPYAPVALHWRLRIEKSRYDISAQANFEIREGLVVEVGREPASAVGLVVNDPKCSKRHAFIQAKERQYWLTDGVPDTLEPSRNGTFIFNDDFSMQRLEPGQSVALKAGSVFRIGYTDIILEQA